MLHEKEINLALATAGGHLTISYTGGWCITYCEVPSRFMQEIDGPSATSRCSYSGYGETDKLLADAIAAGLPCIDCRPADYSRLAALTIRGPMIAVGEEPDAPPYNSLSYAPLSYLAPLYRATGAIVHNVP